jgi:hypothetical protein
MKKCCHCDNTCETWENYCSFDCMIQQAKESGGRTITPNNLPIRCVKANGDMLEHPDADHADYKFPVNVTWVNKPADAVAFDYFDEPHALIYFDEAIALTIWECNYFLWSLKSGRATNFTKSMLTLPHQKLDDSSLEKIKSVSNKAASKSNFSI